MRRSSNYILWISLILMLCGVVLLSAQLFDPSALEITSRVMLAVGCITVIAAAIFSSKTHRSPAFSGFGKAALVNNDVQITFTDVAANKAAKNSLMGLVDYMKHPEKYKAIGARMPKGVILYGPPGTGKTLLARALAGEAGVPFFAISGSDFVQMYVGVGAGRVRELFANARKAGKCVIFIDEIDALGKRRSDIASEERDQTLNALLSEMSGFNSGEGIIVVAATNRIEALDPALLRPGRFDRHIEVGLPGKTERHAILKLHSRNKPLADDIDLEKLANDTCSFSGASLESLLNEAAIIAAERASRFIEKTDIDRAYIRTVAGEDGTHSSNPDERCAIALHEAGHAVVLKKLTPENRLKRISILSAARGTAGYNMSIPAEKRLISKKDMENQIIILLAGRAAELLVGGDDALTSGASGDLARAAEIAGSMVMDLGMCGEPAVSMRALSTACGGISGSADMCRQLLSTMYQQARDLLTDDIELLLRLTSILLEKETLEEAEIDQIFCAAS